MPVVSLIWLMHMKFQLCIFKTVLMYVELNVFVFWLIYSLFLSPRWSIKSSTPPRPVPGSHWIICEVSALNLENCANACRIYVFWVINPLFLTPPGYGRIVNRSHDLYRGSRWRTCEVSTLYLENCVNALWINVFWVVNPLFSSPWGTVESSTCSTTCSWKESPWRPVWEVSALYLENCANACRIYVFWVINPLFSDPTGVR